MLEAAALSFLHFVFLLILAGALSAEALVLRLPVRADVVRLLSRIDLFYGLSALGLIAAGIARVAWDREGVGFLCSRAVLLGQNGCLCARWGAFNLADDDFPALAARAAR
jgi:putative membrane protein